MVDKKLSVVDFKDLVMPERVIPVSGDQAFTVRALNIYELMSVFNEHLSVLDDLIEGKGDLATSTLVEQFPDLAAKVIAVAANNPDLVAKVKKLPTGVQAHALIEIFNMTFPDNELLGKLWARLEEVVTKVAKSVQAERLAAGTLTQ